MEKKIKIINIDYSGISSQIKDTSERYFENIQKSTIVDTEDHITYLALYIRQPAWFKPILDRIPNDTWLMMQQGKVKPLIIMTTEQWDLFENFAWLENKHNITPDFGNVPYSQLVRQFTSRSVAEENITWVTAVNQESQVQEMRQRGYKIASRFIEFNYYKELMCDVAKDYELGEKKFTKHYSCLCQGNAKHHRYGMIYSLWQSQLFEKGNVSCEAYDNIVRTKNSNWIDDKMTADEYMENFADWKANKQGFISLLPIDFDRNPNAHRQMETYNESNIFEQSFLWLSCETKKPDDGIYITEKTYKAIAYGSPFCILGDDGSLDYIKNLGFKTFDTFWDESYDYGSDQEKINKITMIVKNICSKSVSELNTLYKEMLPTLRHNQEQLIQQTQVNNLIRKLRNA